MLHLDLEFVPAAGHAIGSDASATVPAPLRKGWHTLISGRSKGQHGYQCAPNEGHHTAG
jgi:hypothetical protein